MDENILKSLNVYSDKKITAFYNYYSTGNVKYYDELLNKGGVSVMKQFMGIMPHLQ